MRVIEPYLHKTGSKEAGQKWTTISANLNSHNGFNSESPRDQRSVRERFNKLLNDFKDKTRAELAGSGIAPDPLTENETLLEEIVEIMKNVDFGQASASKISQNKEREMALKLRDQAMMTWSKTQKESSDVLCCESDDSDSKSNTTPVKKRKRRSGTDALEYLQQKRSVDAEIRREELAFHKEQVEVERKKLELEQQKQEQLLEQSKQQMQYIQEQATLQQQQFNVMQQQMQQQMQLQSKTMMALVERLGKQ